MNVRTYVVDQWPGGKTLQIWGKHKQNPIEFEMDDTEFEVLVEYLGSYL